MTNEQRKTRTLARKTFPGSRVSHVFPNAYCIAKTAPCCAVLITPPTDREPLVKDKPGLLVQNESAALVTVGDWCQVAYISANHSGQPFILPNAEVTK